MSDRRSTGEYRVKPVTENADVKSVVDRICSLHDGNALNIYRECQALQLKASPESLRKMAIKMGFQWQKPWHADILTTAQKYK